MSFCRKDDARVQGSRLRSNSPILKSSPLTVTVTKQQNKSTLSTVDYTIPMYRHDDVKTNYKKNDLLFKEPVRDPIRIRFFPFFRDLLLLLNLQLERYDVIRSK